MKTRFIFIIILLLVLVVLLTRNDDRISDILLSIINPIKQNYKSLSQEIEDKSHSIIFQKESIEKLSMENRVLRKRLLEQTHYIRQVKNIYSILPDLSQHPVHNISIVETISYVKLNSFSQIILTKPKEIMDNKLYGLIQGTVVAGIGKLRNNQLYGYLTSDSRCRFSVFLGDKKAPGIAVGVKKNEMIVKFIPKWHKVDTGDKVITSGLDNIFFAGIPVGVVTSVKIKSSYKIAYIKTYSDVFHPKTFFLINNARDTLVEGFDSKATQLNRRDYSIPQNSEQNRSEIIVPEHNQTLPIISSIPSRIDQTQEEIVEPETPSEKVNPHKSIKKKNIDKKSKPKLKNKPRLKPAESVLDMF